MSRELWSHQMERRRVSSVTEVFEEAANMVTLRVFLQLIVRGKGIITITNSKNKSFQMWIIWRDGSQGLEIEGRGENYIFSGNIVFFENTQIDWNSSHRYSWWLELYRDIGWSSFSLLPWSLLPLQRTCEWIHLDHLETSNFYTLNCWRDLI